ncbi:MAG: hypothetical protein M1834_002521 [Cirrosporium novae-zelandiae]|nr:MAG: hypothetical protein M1834_002521 [Cirrosporium novae-zelandiae]
MPKYTDTSGDTYTGIYEFMRLSLYSGACWIFEIQQFKAYDGDSGNFCNVSSAWSESADSTDLPDNLSDITVFDDTCSHISIESYSDANTGDITGMLNSMRRVRKPVRTVRTVAGQKRQH